MAVHLTLELLEIDGLAAFPGELDSELDRKSVRRLEDEGLLAADLPFSRSFLEQPHAAIESLGEALFLVVQDSVDLFAVCAELRIGLLHLDNDRVRELR